MNEPYPFSIFNTPFTRFVSSTNSCTDSCSGRRSKRASCVRGQSFPMMGLMELRSVLRRWLKVVFTTCLNRRSSHPSSCVSLRVMRMTALFTLGGGLNTFSWTVKRYSTRYRARSGCHTSCCPALRPCVRPPPSVSCPCSRVSGPCCPAS